METTQIIFVAFLIIGILLPTLLAFVKIPPVTGSVIVAASAGLIIGLLAFSTYRVIAYLTKDEILVLPLNAIATDDSDRLAAYATQSLSAQLTEIRNVYQKGQALSKDFPIPGLDQLILPAATAASKNGQSSLELGAISFGPFRISTHSIFTRWLALFKRLTISGNIKQSGESVSISLTVTENGERYSLPIHRTDGGTIDEVIQTSAYDVINQLLPSRFNSSDGLRSFSKGLNSYTSYLQGGKRRSLDEAVDHLRRAERLEKDNPVLELLLSRMLLQRSTVSQTWESLIDGHAALERYERLRMASDEEGPYYIYATLGEVTANAIILQRITNRSCAARRRHLRRLREVLADGGLGIHTEKESPRATNENKRRFPDVAQVLGEYGEVSWRLARAKAALGILMNFECLDAEKQPLSVSGDVIRDQDDLITYVEDQIEVAMRVDPNYAPTLYERSRLLMQKVRRARQRAEGSAHVKDVRNALVAALESQKELLEVRRGGFTYGMVGETSWRIAGTYTGEQQAREYLNEAANAFAGQVLASPKYGDKWQWGLLRLSDVQINMGAWRSAFETFGTALEAFDETADNGAEAENGRELKKSADTLRTVLSTSEEIVCVDKHDGEDILPVLRHLTSDEMNPGNIIANVLLLKALVVLDYVNDTEEIVKRLLDLVEHPYVWLSEGLQMFLKSVVAESAAPDTWRNVVAEAAGVDKDWADRVLLQLYVVAEKERDDEVIQKIRTNLPELSEEEIPDKCGRGRSLILKH